MGCGKYGVRKVWGVESSGAGLLALNPQPIVPKIGISEVLGWKCNDSRQSCFCWLYLSSEVLSSSGIYYKQNEMSDSWKGFSFLQVTRFYSGISVVPTMLHLTILTNNIVLFGCMSSRGLCQGSAPSIFFFFEISILWDKEKEIVGSSPAAKGQHMNIRTSLNIYTRGFICSQIFCRFYNT